MQSIPRGLPTPSSKDWKLKVPHDFQKAHCQPVWELYGCLDSLLIEQTTETIFQAATSCQKGKALKPVSTRGCLQSRASNYPSQQREVVWWLKDESKTYIHGQGERVSQTHLNCPKFI